MRGPVPSPGKLRRRGEEMANLNKATKCMAFGSKGFHEWMSIGLTEQGERREICSNTGCACVRSLDEDGKLVPGSFLPS